MVKYGKDSYYALNEIYFPSNDYKIKEGYYTIGEIVKLLRKYKKHPSTIQFIADMLE